MSSLMNWRLFFDKRCKKIMLVVMAVFIISPMSSFANIDFNYQSGKQSLAGDSKDDYNWWNNLKRSNDKRDNDDWSRDRNDKKWDAFKWDDRKWGDNKWDNRNWCSVDQGCSAKELSKGQVNMCVNMKHKNTQICVSQKKADFWLNFSQVYKNKIFSTTKTFYKDADGDTYGSNSLTVQGCGETAPKGYANRGNDCNDNDKKINPGMADGCPVIDGKDNNCDGVVDNGRVNVYTDKDQDTYGDTSTMRLACPSATTSDRGGDCNDNNNAINPAALEVACDGVDNNCDGSDQQDLTAYPDIDNDGFGDSNSQGYPACSGIQNNADCDDSSSAIKPGAVEICDNGKDDNCDGKIDSQDADTCGVQQVTCPCNFNPGYVYQTSAMRASALANLFQNFGINIISRSYGSYEQQPSSGIGEYFFYTTPQAYGNFTGPLSTNGEYKLKASLEWLPGTGYKCVSGDGSVSTFNSGFSEQYMSTLTSGNIYMFTSNTGKTEDQLYQEALECEKQFVQNRDQLQSPPIEP